MWGGRAKFARRSVMEEALNQLSQRFQSFASDAQAMALKQLMQITHRQGVVMAFPDVFLLLTFLFGGLAIAALLVRQPSPGAAAPALRRSHFARPVSVLASRIKFSR